MAEKSTGGVQSVERVFELLELITDAGGDVTLSELSSSTDLPLPTIHRLLRTLVTLGYIRQLPNRRYALGPRLIRLGEGANKQLGAVARPELKSLVDQLGETSNMAVLDSDLVIYVAQVPSLHSMRMFTEVGRRAHTHATGVGKAILAQLDDDVVRGIVARAGMPTPTPKSIGDVDELLADLKLIRERGYSIDEEEQEIGVRCFAMAVPNAPTPAAISVSGPVSRVDQSFGDRAVPILRKAAQDFFDGNGLFKSVGAVHARQEHFRHAALGQQSQDAVAKQLGSRLELRGGTFHAQQGA
ncbi:MAG: allantoin degradation transcriptional regulator AllR [Pseudarthrobacter sp.]